MPGSHWMKLVLVHCLVLISCTSLAVCYTRAYCSNRSGRSESSTQSAAAAGPTKRPVTVADSIQMTHLGDPLYNDGAPSKGLVAKFSPDGKRFAVVLRKGNLETNTNEYSLVMFATDEVFRLPRPRVLLSMSSSSNRPAIQNVVWMDDNETILFLGERPGETTQLYSLKCSSKELKRLTNHATNISSFALTAKDAVIIFVAESPELTFVNEESVHHGIRVTNELLSDLIAGKHGGGEYDDHMLFIKAARSEAESRITTEGRIGPDNEMSLSPDGLHLILRTEARHVPDTWAEYEDPFLKPSRRPLSAPGARTSVFYYELVDLTTRTSRLLLDAPIAPVLGSETTWSPDSQSVIVANAYLPLEIDDAAERTQRKTHTYLAEFRIASRQLVEISDEDLRLLDWDAKTNEVECDIGRVDSLNGKATAKAYFRKSNDNGTWSRSSVPKEPAKAAPALPDIVLDENMNQPPRIFAIDPGTGQKSLLMDLNPKFQGLTFAKVEEITFQTSGHKRVRAGLYWPVDHIAGKKYPLIIQTHAWEPDRFWMDGPFTTAFAAQALAGKGFFVLQVDEHPKDMRLADTPKEVSAAMEVYDGAIDFLDHKGLIDRGRIGITGFSRTYWYITYALLHSKHHFAAADLTDGVDYSYFQYMALSNYDQTWAGSFEQTNRAAPFGKGLLQWFKLSPAFRMDKIETSLRIQALGPVSLLGDWPWFSGLTRLGKPVEMIYLPDGTHILEKPWDRMVSQQGNVDWFCFWLKGEEDPDPAKAQQYARWRELRVLQEENEKKKHAKQ